MSNYCTLYKFFQEQQCTDCDGGMYCAHEGATNFTDQCSAGYYCESGVDRPNPNYVSSNDSVCPPLGGHTGKLTGLQKFMRLFE